VTWVNPYACFGHFIYCIIASSNVESADIIKFQQYTIVLLCVVGIDVYLCTERNGDCKT